MRDIGVCILCHVSNAQAGFTFPRIHGHSDGISGPSYWDENSVGKESTRIANITFVVPKPHTLCIWNFDHGELHYLLRMPEPVSKAAYLSLFDLAF